MDKLLHKIQMFCYGMGADKEFCTWDKIGNKIQDIRSKYIILNER